MMAAEPNLKDRVLTPEERDAVFKHRAHLVIPDALAASTAIGATDEATVSRAGAFNGHKRAHAAAAPPLVLAIDTHGGPLRSRAVAVPEISAEVLRVPRSPALFVGRIAEMRRLLAAATEVRLSLIYGVAGVGKTAFMLRAAESLAATLDGRLAYHRCRPEEAATSVAAALVDQIAPPPRMRQRASDPVDQIVHLATTSPVVLCIDDAHHAADSGIVELLVDLAAQRRSVWSFVTSRELLPISPLTVDHVLTRLGLLPIDDTRELWTALEHLYGPPAMALQLSDRILESGATPLVVKQMFAGQLDHDDAFQLQDLPATPRALLGLLCAFRRPVPVAALADAGDEISVRTSLQDLARRFLVETVAPDKLSIHDVVRGAVHRSGLAPGPHEQALCLAYYQRLPRTAADDEQMERLWHSVGCGRDDLALAIITEHASELHHYPHGSAVVERDLAAAIDTLATRVALSPEIQLFRQRVRARQGHVAEAYVAAAAYVGIVPAAELDLADMARALGRLDDSIAHATRAAYDERLSPAMRAFAFAVLFDGYRGKGQLERALEIQAEARALLDRLGHVGAVTWSAMQAMWAYDRQRYDEAADHIAAATTASAARDMPFSLPLLASLDRTVAVARGAAPTRDPAGELDDETLHFRYAARLLHAQELVFRGEAIRAAELARETVEAARSHELASLVSWGIWVWARAAALLGRSHSVAALVADAFDEAVRLGHQRALMYLHAEIAHAHLTLGGAAQACEIATLAARRAEGDAGVLARVEVDQAQASYLAGKQPQTSLGPVIDAAEGHDRASAQLARCELLLWEGNLAASLDEANLLFDRARAAGWRWIALRSQILAAEATYRAGNLRAAAIALPPLVDEARRMGYEVDGLRAALLAAGIARAHGDVARASAILVDTVARARDASLAIEHDAAQAALATLEGNEVAPRSPGTRLARRLHLSQPATIRLHEARDTYCVSARHATELDWPRFTSVLDLAERRVWLESRWVDLSRHGALVDAIAVLARSAGQLVPVADLVRGVWNLAYHPLRHHSRVTTTMSRARKLLGEDVVQGTRDGYRLLLPEPWLVLERMAGSGA
jgi:hypothetical protein